MEVERPKGEKSERAHRAAGSANAARSDVLSQHYRTPVATAVDVGELRVSAKSSKMILLQPNSRID